MTVLETLVLSEEELSKIVAQYAGNVINKHEHISFWHVMRIISQIPDEKRWQNQTDLPFIRECLLKNDIGKISELKEFRGEKEKQQTPFHMLSVQRPEDPRDHCPECEIHGNQGCPQHMEIVRNLFKS